LLGEFFDNDQILVVLNSGECYLSTFDANNHYEENILRIEKYDPSKVWTAILYDADNQAYPYMKRFLMDATKKKQNWLSDNPQSKLILLTDTAYPLIKVTYGGADEFRGAEEIDAEQFIAVKGYKAKGKRLTTWQIENIEELEPIRFPEKPENADDSDDSEYADGSEYADDSDNSEELTPSEDTPAPRKSQPHEELSLFDDEE
jgi:topoisomerase-4 subunit A